MGAIKTTRPDRDHLMSVADLKTTMEYRHLPPKMGVFLSEYCQKFIDDGILDPLAAVLASYKCSTRENARTFGYQLLRNPKVILALNRFFGKSPAASFLEEVERAIYNRKLTMAQVRALELRCKALGLSVPDGLPHRNGYESVDREPKRFNPGDLAVIDGVPSKVISVNDAGRPLEAEPIS